MIAWPDTHPILTDAALAPWAYGADELCPDARVVSVLRYLPGRRVATLIERDGQRGVLKVFASPRARGNHRRLVRLAGTDAAPVIPVPRGVDGTGHVSLVEFVPGTSMPDLDDDRYVEAARLAGSILIRLHRSSASLDRAWSVTDELTQLRRTAGATSGALVDSAIAATPLPAVAVDVPSHRDCHPAQLVLRPDGTACWVDLDDAAMAPAGLDVGNFVAHLELESALGRRRREVVHAAVQAFVHGYGDHLPDVEWWRRLSITRLVALAETRHHDTERMARLGALLGWSSTVSAARATLP